MGLNWLQVKASYFQDMHVCVGLVLICLFDQLMSLPKHAQVNHCAKALGNIIDYAVACDVVIQKIKICFIQHLMGATSR